jgi:hypothetical protein
MGLARLMYYIKHQAHVFERAIAAGTPAQLWHCCWPRLHLLQLVNQTRCVQDVVEPAFGLYIPANIQHRVDLR